MKSQLPITTEELMQAEWKDFEPAARELADFPLTGDNLYEWLADWSTLAGKGFELYNRMYVARTLNTGSKEIEERFNNIMDDFYPRLLASEQRLKEKLIASHLEPEGFSVLLRNMRSDASLFRENNLPLLSEAMKLSSEYDRIIGSQTVQWDGEEVTVTQLRPVFQETDRQRREDAWRLSMNRWYADRDAITGVWQKLLPLRQKIAANADKPDFRTFRWQFLQRFDYTPQDCYSFHDAIEEVVVPAASRIYERRRQQLGLDVLRPWDLDVDTTGLPALKPFNNIDELTKKTAIIFNKVDPELGHYFSTLMQENLLDLENRKHKGPGAYCIDLPDIRKPFVFANAVGIHDDVATLLHESGHAFHFLESCSLPFYHQLNPPMEFAEVASMSMELLAAPYLTDDHAGFYSSSEAARARIQHIESNILFWPYMSVIDLFQHWVYENPQKAMDGDACDEVFSKLWDRFTPGVDWTGLEKYKTSGWHRKAHIYAEPFYYIEYGLAQLGATLIYGNARKDQHAAVASYRKALALGGTVPLPELYKTAGARLAFDSKTLREAITILEDVLAELQTQK
jgi:oligoendopeptidase F